MEPAPLRFDSQPDRYQAKGPRGRAALLALSLEGLIIASLIYGLAGPLVQSARRPASLVAIALDPPPPEENRLRAKTPAADSSAASAAPKAEAAPIVMPKQIIIAPTPLLAARIPAASLGTKPGSSDHAGPGSGNGGQGSGSGSGAGDGGGDGGGADPEWNGGKIKNGDYPKAVREAHISGTTVAEVAVGSNGRPTACRVIRTSGSRELDMTTCQLIMQRFKFKPARNSAGAAISGTIEYEQEWDAPPPPPPD